MEVLYNACHGGFSISDKAYNLYNERKKELDPTWTSVPKYLLSRTDPILIQIYKELIGDDEFNGTYSRIKLITIPKKYENYYCIDEIGGLEMIEILYDKYKLSKIDNILKNEESNHDKIQSIRQIIDEK